MGVGLCFGSQTAKVRFGPKSVATQGDVDILKEGTPPPKNKKKQTNKMLACGVVLNPKKVPSNKKAHPYLPFASE